LSFLTWKKNRKFQCWDRKKVFAVSCFSFFSRLLCATVRWFTCSVNCEFFFSLFRYFFLPYCVGIWSRLSQPVQYASPPQFPFKLKI
jgi:hypothetical protein